MKKYILITETGFQGIGYYATYDEAAKAAEIRQSFTNCKWFVKELISR